MKDIDIKLMRLMALVATLLMVSCGSSEQSADDLPKRADIWVTSIELGPDSKVKLVGKTKNYLITSVTSIKDVNTQRKISVGDTIEGIRIGAIKCTFHWKDSSYGGEQFMWRGRWACKAGRNKQEVENAVGPDGEKRFDYLHISPVTLKE